MKFPATLRELLNHLGFDWGKGRIVFQEAKSYRPGHASREYYLPCREISKTDPILDWRAKDTVGAQLPRVIAFDSRGIYFPEAFRCADSMMIVFTHPEAYLDDPNLPTPYYVRW